MPHIMKTILSHIFLILTVGSFAQGKRAEDYGFRQIQLVYKRDTIDILVKSSNGEEQTKKPLFLFCQGSLPQPLIKYDEQGAYGVFPFNPDSLSLTYHIIIISKPFIPLICNIKSLGNDFTYLDSTGKFPKNYSDRNLLDYYVDRDIYILKCLRNQPWVSKKRLVVAGHSEGSTVASKIALLYPQVTHLIYSGGNPMGRIMSIIGQSRSIETDSTKYGEEEIKYWQRVVEDSSNMDASQADTYKATFEFSKSSKEYLDNLRVPVLICYGTKDWSTPFNDYVRVDMMRKGKHNFTFKAYIGLEHNYFPLLPNGQINYDIYNWDNVANDWKKWLEEK
jgi:hypothetical protein